MTPGFRAELVLVDGDPLADVAVLEHPVGVLLGGTWLDAAELAALHHAASQHDPERTRANLQAALAAQAAFAHPAE